MAPTNPLTSSLGTIRDTALGALTDPKGTAGRALDQAREAVSHGRSLVEGVAARVAARAPGRRSQHAPAPADAARPPTVRAVPEHEPPRPHGDAVAPSGPEDPAPAAKATPRKATGPAAKTTAPVREAPAQKRTVQKKAGTTPSPTRTPAKKAAAKRAPSKKAAVTEPALRGGTRDEVVYTTETPGAPAAPGDPAPGPGEDSLIDPGTAKQIAKEAERGRRDAEPS